MNRNRHMHLWTLLTVLLFYPLTPALAETIAVTDFNQPSLADWERKTFNGQTRYSLHKSDSTPCIHAESRASASGLYKKIPVDLNKTPYLHWRWKIARPLNNRHERERRGDDFSARIYLIVSGGLFFWNTKAINYVWASQEAIGNSWDNPYTSHSAMLAVESGTEYAGQWRQYRRNVRKDLQRLFGTDIDHIDAIAIMTDTDNTGQQASACYGDIRFSSN